MRSLSDYLNLTAEQARSQWGQILQRQPKKRQEPFTPVEVILCYGLFYVVNPYRYGGSTIHRAPPVVHQLARLFVRPPASITNKMMNLEGRRAHAAKHEWRFFLEMAVDSAQFPQLYERVLLAARDMGVGPDRLSDFVPAEGDFDLLGGWCQMGVWCDGVGGGGAGAGSGRALWCGGVCWGLSGRCWAGVGRLGAQPRAHRCGVERSPSTPRRAMLAAAASRLKSASTLARPRTRAWRPPCFRRMRCASLRSTLGRTAR